MNNSILMAVLTVLLLSAPSVEAKIVTVSKNGAINSIQAGIDAAAANDIVLIKSGRYQENLVVGAALTGLKIKGEGNVILDARPVGGLGAGPGITVAAMNVSISNLTIRNAYPIDQTLGFAISGTADGLNVKNVTLHQNYYGIEAEGDNVVISGCHLYHNGSPVEIYGGNCTIEFNTIRNCRLDGIRVTGDGATIRKNKISFIEDGAGIHVVQGANAAVTKNKIDTTNYTGIEITGDGAAASDNKLRRIREGVVLIGHDATVKNNEITSCKRVGVDVFGDSAKVHTNTLTCAGVEEVTNVGGIKIEGANASVKKNLVSDVLGKGISIIGDLANVNNNTVTGTNWGESVRVSGDMPVITDNKLSRAINDNTVLRVEDATSGGTIDGNSIYDSMDGGLRVSSSSNNLIISNNVVRNCGCRYEAGFEIHGTGHVLTGNTARGNRGDGFYIRASNASLNKNTAQNNGIDGFDIHDNTTDSVTLTNNKALGNGAEGIENNGTNSIIDNNTSMGNRTDFATDGSEMSFSGNVIKDGSDQTTLPEFDQ